MVLSASRLASRFSSTVIYTTSTEFLAEKVWESLGIFGRVGAQTIAADAFVYKSCLPISLVSEVKFTGTGLITGSQSLASVVDDCPGSWRQSNGQDDLWVVHQDVRVEIGTDEGSIG